MHPSSQGLRYISKQRPSQPWGNLWKDRGHPKSAQTHPRAKCHPPLSYSMRREESCVLGPGVLGTVLCWSVIAEVLLWQSGERQPLGATVANVVVG